MTKKGKEIKEKGKPGVMREYTVVWQIQVSATGIREAAQEAMRSMPAGTFSTSEATCFDVIVGKRVYCVDIADPDELITTGTLYAYKRDLKDVEPGSGHTR
jgi:hypothetical protein